jgi:excisionase family DNA binding protein
MRTWRRNFENIRVISWRGPIYTVEEVSDLLGIPRPTLYRYLREYSIPHYRRSGKISIPEESFDRIREARDLHKEGLGTESVRRVLREGGAPAGGELSERLDALSATLKDLQDKSAGDEAVSSPALRTLLARQSLLISAVFNLTEMVEDLLLASGKPRKTVFGEVAGELRAVTPLREYAQRRRLGGGESPVAVAEPTPKVPTDPPARQAVPERPGRFGHLSRRRRRWVLAVVAILLVGGLLASQLPTLLGDRTAEPPPPAAAGQEEGREDPAGGASGRGPEEADNASGAREPNTGGPVETAPGEVPDVSGRSVEEAARSLSEAGFAVAAIRTEAGPEEAGTVTGTDPPAGTDAEPGTPVIIVMSGGSGER